MSRYAEAQYGEQPIAIGIFEHLDAVTIQLLDLGTDTLIPITPPADVCSESTQLPGFFTWDAANCDTPPTGFHQCLYVMTNTAGRTHAGKLVIGGYPSDSAIRRFQQKVWIDVAAGSAGTTFPLGTPENPVSNVLDARIIADRENITAYHVKGAIVLTANHEDWTFEGEEPIDDYVAVVAGVSVDRSQFATIGIRGNLTGHITCKECLIGSSGGTVTGLSGTFTTCGFDGTIVPLPAYLGGKIQGLDLASQNANVLDPGTVIDFANNLCIVLGSFIGYWRVRNIDDALAILAMAGSGLHLTAESTVDGGVFTLIGQGEFVNQATSITDLRDFLVRGSQLSKVWDGTVGTRLVDQTSDPAQWKLRVRKGDDDSVTSHSFDLADGEGDPISDANPLTQFIGERTRI